jgi:hypothetical protein
MDDIPIAIRGWLEELENEIAERKRRNARDQAAVEESYKAIAAQEIQIAFRENEIEELNAHVLCIRRANDVWREHISGQVREAAVVRLFDDAPHAPHRRSKPRRR